MSRERAPSAQILDDVLRCRCQVGVKQNRHLKVNHSVQSTSQLSSSAIFVLSRLDLPNIQHPSTSGEFCQATGSQPRFLEGLLARNPHRWGATLASTLTALSAARTLQAGKAIAEQTEFPTAPTNDVLVHLPSAEGRWENSCSGLVD